MGYEWDNPVSFAFFRYLIAAYALKGVTSSEQKRFHDGIKERFDDSPWSKLLELPKTFSDYV